VLSKGFSLINLLNSHGKDPKARSTHSAWAEVHRSRSMAGFLESSTEDLGYPRFYEEKPGLLKVYRLQHCTMDA
jgi:hypothetical protein